MRVRCLSFQKTAYFHAVLKQRLFNIPCKSKVVLLVPISSLSQSNQIFCENKTHQQGAAVTFLFFKSLKTTTNKENHKTSRPRPCSRPPSFPCKSLFQLAFSLTPPAALSVAPSFPVTATPDPSLTNQNQRPVNFKP